MPIDINVKRYVGTVYILDPVTAAGRHRCHEVLLD